MLRNNVNDSDQMSCVQRPADKDRTYSEHIPSNLLNHTAGALVALADHGGLTASLQYCFATCALGVQAYRKNSADDSVR